MIIYLDESGQSTGFTKRGSSKTFNIALVVTNDPDPIKRTLRSFEKKLIRKGWPKKYEVKASRIYSAKRDNKICRSYPFKEDFYPPLEEIFHKLCNCSIEVDFISIKKRWP